MIQIYHEYTEWEDFKNGMYETVFVNEDKLIQKAIDLLSNKDLFFKTSVKMIDDWIISSDVNLSNVRHNRRSWIGQAACCYKYGVPESLTRFAWADISSIKKIEANNVADKIIRIYEERYKRIYKDMGGEMLF